MHEKKLVYIIAVSFICGLVPGLLLYAFSAGTRWHIADSAAAESAGLRERLEQVNRDLGSALSSEHEASERAARLQEELLGIAAYARSLEAGTGRIETGIGNLADELGAIIVQSGELSGGIGRAFDSLDESRILLEELGIIIRGLQTDGAAENQQP
ncbi:MAG: hypothetical protein FWD78_11005 [Treponema sp.]|nr:hypothetical protein [Treponema sp.]